MSSPSIPELEARIRADRAALRANRRRLRMAAEQRMASGPVLLGSFVTGLAGGWVLKGTNRAKEVRRLRAELGQARGEASAQADLAGTGLLVSLLPLVGLGLRLAAALQPGGRKRGPGGRSGGAGT